MTIKAFILIETERGRCREVNNVLRKIDGVHLSEAVTPPYDIIAIAESERRGDIDQIVEQKIPLIDGVTRAVVCTASEACLGIDEVRRVLN